MMPTYTLSDAKAQLSRLINLAAAGEEVTITKRGRAIAKLVPFDLVRQQRPGLAEHRAQMTLQAEPASEFIRNLRESDRY